MKFGIPVFGEKKTPVSPYVPACEFDTYLDMQSSSHCFRLRYSWRAEAAMEGSIALLSHHPIHGRTGRGRNRTSRLEPQTSSPTHTHTVCSQTISYCSNISVFLHSAMLFLHSSLFVFNRNLFHKNRHLFHKNRHLFHKNKPSYLYGILQSLKQIQWHHFSAAKSNYCQMGMML